MFKIEFAHISVASLSFQLPAGFILLDPEEPHVNSTLSLQSPDGSYLITVSLDRSENTSDAELRSILSEGGYCVLAPVSPFTRNGVSGHSAAYLSGKRGYWELRLDLPADDPSGPNTLVFQISTHWGRGILTLMDAQPLQSLLKSIQPLCQ